MESTTYMVMDLLSQGKIPDTTAAQGLTFYDLRPGFSSTVDQRFTDFDVIQKCSEIMRRDPNQAQKGKDFLAALYNEVIVPAFRPDSQIETEGTLMHWAASTGHEQAFVDMNDKANAKKYSSPDEKGRSPVQIALQNGHFGVATKLIAAGFYPPNKMLSDAMMEACRNGHLQFVQEVINQCIGETALRPIALSILDPKPINGETPFSIACGLKSPEIALVLLPYLSIADHPPGQSPLDIAIRKGNLPVARAILENLNESLPESVATIVNQITPGNFTPLIQATMKGDPEMVDLLVDHGGDPLKTVDGTSALQVATNAQNKILLLLFEPAVRADKHYQETKSLIERTSADFAERKEPKLPRNKLKHKLIGQALTILQTANEGPEKGQMTTQNIRTKPIALSALHLDDKEKKAFVAHLQKLRGNAYLGAAPKTSLQDILDFQTKPAFAKKRGPEFFKKPKSSQQFSRENIPESMRSQAYFFLKDVADRLKKSPDIASTKEKRAALEARRLDKIAKIDKIMGDLVHSNVSTLKELCAFGEPNILQVLNMHRDPSKEGGTKDTKSYQEFYKLFRLDKHPEVDTSRAATQQGRKDRESLAPVPSDEDSDSALDL